MYYQRSPCRVVVAFAAVASTVAVSIAEENDSRVAAPDVRPYLSVAYKLVESDSSKVIETLEAGQQYDVLVSVKADQREGAKINPLFRTQEVRLDLIDDRVKYTAEPRTRQEKSNPKSRTVRIDPKSGSAKFTIALVEGDSLAATEVRLKLIADLMVCDEMGTYCVKTREEALLALPVGSGTMKPLPLGFNAGDKERVVLKVADEAPDFTVTCAESTQVRLSDYRSKKNVILLFGRAHW